MNSMSPRERMLALIVVSVVGVAILYQFVLEPFFQKREDLNAKIEDRRQDMDKAARVFREQKRLQTVLTGMTAGGLKSDVAEARSQLIYAVSGWTKDSGLTFTSIKEGRTLTEAKWVQINTQLTGTGPQKAIAELLWRLETAEIPIRVTEMTVNARNEGVNDLQINLGISTLCQNPDAEKTDPAVRRTVASAGGR